MDISDKFTDRPKSHSWQFSLKSLLALMAVVGLILGWISSERHQVQKQREAVTAIGHLHGGIFYAVDRKGEPTDRTPASMGWLWQLFCIDWQDNVVALNLNSKPVTDADLTHISKFRRLNYLELSCRGGQSRVTDAGLVHLVSAKQLETLLLDGTEVSDTGMIHLKNLGRLTNLSLSGNGISDAGLVHLRDLRRLKYLALMDTNVTEAGVRKLQEALPKAEISVFKR